MLIIMSSMIILPIFLQTGAGLSVFIAGLMLLPGSALNGLLSPFIGRVFDKFGPKWLVIPGLILVTTMLWFFTTLTTASSVAFIVALHVGFMVGIAMIWMPSQSNGLNQLPPVLYPHATSIMNTLQQGSGAIGAAVAVSILTGGMDSYLHSSSAPTQPAEIANAMVSGLQNVFLFTVGIAVIGLVMGFFIRRVIVQREVINSPH